MGPERAERSWDKALDKAKGRALLWAQAGLGLQFAAVVYRVYVASTLSFLAQLEPLPSRWQMEEERMLRVLVPGPHRWCSAQDLLGLQTPAAGRANRACQD